jgi:DNA-directed RNA polymerase specialized sigma24 family protein
MAIASRAMPAPRLGAPLPERDALRAMLHALATSVLRSRFRSPARAEAVGCDVHALAAAGFLELQRIAQRASALAYPCEYVKPFLTNAMRREVRRALAWSRCTVATVPDFDALPMPAHTPWLSRMRYTPTGGMHGFHGLPRSVRRAIGTLPPRQRQVLRLVVLQGERPTDVATRLGCSLNAITVAQSLALKTLRRRLVPVPVLHQSTGQFVTGDSKTSRRDSTGMTSKAAHGHESAFARSTPFPAAA